MTVYTNQRVNTFTVRSVDTVSLRMHNSIICNVFPGETAVLRLDGTHNIRELSWFRSRFSPHVNDPGDEILAAGKPEVHTSRARSDVDRTQLLRAG
jgi:hypothetical protein